MTSAGRNLEAEVEYALTTGYGYVYVENVFGERKWVRINTAAAHLGRVVGLNEYVSSSEEVDNRDAADPTERQ